MKLVDLDKVRALFYVSETCDKCQRNNTDCDRRETYTPRDICELLDEAEEVDAVPRCFGWWGEESDRERHWHCSQCGTVQGIACVGMKYCPNCGAEMAEHPWAASGCGQTFSPD